MQQQVAQRRSWLFSCLCCCCWSCLSELFWSNFSSRQERRYTAVGENNPTVTRVSRSREERRRLLPETPKLSSTPVVEESDQKKQFEIAGMPKFPGEGSALPKTTSHMSLTDLADDSCPTCLEVYTEDNPKIITKCGHHFHLACIYEWLERANTCPVCFRPMGFDELQ